MLLSSPAFSSLDPQDVPGEEGSAILRIAYISYTCRPISVDAA